MAHCRTFIHKTQPSTHTHRYNNEALSLSFPYRQLQWSYLVFVNSYLLFHPSLLLHDYRMGAVPLITSLLDHRILLTFVAVAFYASLLIYAFSKRNPVLLNLFGRRKLALKAKGVGRFDHMTNDAIDDSASASQRTKQVKFETLKSPYLKRDRFTSKEVLLFGLSLMIFPFLPASNLFFPVGFVVAERVLYLPSMGFCMLVAYGAHRLTQVRGNWPSLIGKLGIVLLVTMHSIKTFHRARDWYSKETLFKSLVKHYPRNGYVLGNLALNLFRSGDEVVAEKLNRFAMEVAPDVPLSFVNLGSLLKKQGRLDEAELVGIM